MVVAVLHLRRWARALLAGDRLLPTDADISLGMGLFLESERCAVLLERLLREVTQPHADLRQIAENVKRRSAQEGVRIRRARDALAVVGEIARESKLRVVVLKGGVAAADDATAVDLIDVDLLTEPRQARRLVAALDERGFHVVGASSPRHLAARAKDDGLPIEVHTTLSRDGTALPHHVWERVKPLCPLSGIFRLAWPDHLWHLLEHVVIDHPERRGLIRELMLIGQAIAECSEDDLTVVNRRIEGCSNRRALREVFEAADHLRKGRCDNVRLESVAAAFYSVRVVLQPVSLPSFLEAYVYKWAFGWLMGRAARRSLWNEIWFVSLDRSTNPSVAWLEQWARPVARPTRLSLRLARALIAAAIARPISLVAGGVARSALSQVGYDKQ